MLRYSREDQGVERPSHIAASDSHALSRCAKALWSEGMQGLTGQMASDLVPSFSEDNLKEEAGTYDLGELEQPLGFGLDEDPGLHTHGLGELATAEVTSSHGGEGMLSGMQARYDLHSRSTWHGMASSHAMRTSMHNSSAAMNSAPSGHPQNGEYNSPRHGGGSSGPASNMGAGATARNPSFESPSNRPLPTASTNSASAAAAMAAAVVAAGAGLAGSSGGGGGGGSAGGLMGGLGGYVPNGAMLRRHDSWTTGGLHEAGSPATETSTDMEGDIKVDHYLEEPSQGASSDVEPETKPKLSGTATTSSSRDIEDKALRRLAQNREAARKSRLRKKAYVQQLETSRLRLQQLEQELIRARQQNVHVPSTQDPYMQSGMNINNASAASSAGAAAFDMEYQRWLEEHTRHICELRGAVNSRLADNEVRPLVEIILTHYDELFLLKAQAAKMDVFHLVSGMWKTPAERCFMWMGGFRPSELLKILIPQIEPLAETQLLSVCNLQQSSAQAEDALSHGMEALQQSLAETLSAGSLGNASNVANYMGQMAMAMGKLGTLESFVRQADSLRQQSLQQMNRILNTRQLARSLLAMGDYFARLRALSSLWAARPRE